MSTTRELRDAIREMVKVELPYTVLCTVAAVDLDDMLCDCEPLDEGGNILDVKLMSANEKGFLIVPKVGSTVLVSFMSEETGYISMFSEVDEIQLNSDTFGGLVKVSDLVGKMNAIENDLNDIKQVFSTSWTPVPNDGGAALKTAAATWAGSTFTPTTDSELENTTVKHGDGT